MGGNLFFTPVPFWSFKISYHVWITYSKEKEQKWSTLEDVKSAGWLREELWLEFLYTLPYAFEDLHVSEENVLLATVYTLREDKYMYVVQRKGTIVHCNNEINSND